MVGATFDGSRDRKEDVLREALRRWDDLLAEDMYLIGDTIFDVEGAKAVGMACVAVTFGFGDVQQMKEAGIVGICTDMHQLPALIAQ